jgi:NADH:ubiquinone oxidoreductase subunit F (NADH-binding)
LVSFSQDSGTPLYRLQEVASFFPHFRLTPAPQVTVKVCRDMACHLAGAGAALEQLRAIAGERVCVEGVSCLGRCDRPLAACVEVHQTRNQGGQEEHEFYYSGRTAAGIIQIATAFLENQASPAGTGGATDALEYPAADWMIDPYKGGIRDYAAVRKVAAARDQELRKADGGAKSQEWNDQVLADFDDANLRGMGGAGVPASKKWWDVREAVAKVRRRGADDPAFIVVNGDESEPATFKDRELLLHYPHLIVEGVILAGLVTGASEGFLYIRHEYPEQIAACRAEIRRAESMGLCGETAPVLGRPFPVSVFVSPGGYICGEQTALLEAMSDRRGEPRDLAPKLETNGLDDLPTLVSNVETFAWTPYILIHGGRQYGSLGVNGRQGRRFFSICGDVKRPGVYEVPMGLTLRELIHGDDYCGGIVGGKKLKAIAPSGPSGGFLPARLTTAAGLPGNHTANAEWQSLAQRRGFDPLAQELDILDMELELNLFRALRHALGAGIVVYAEGRDMTEQAVNALEFFRNESCGKCAPCRIGSQKLANLGANILAGRVDAGTWTREVQPLVSELAEVISLASICGLGRSVPQPLQTLVDYFGNDLAGHLRKGDTAP